MLKLSSLKADLARENDGAWMDVPEWPGVSLKVRGLNYPAYELARNTGAQIRARKTKNAASTSAESTAFFGRLYAEHILLDWKGLVSDDRQMVPYSKERALEILTDPAFREFVAAVESAAARVAQVDVEFIEGAAKNSEQPSATG